MDNAGVPEGDAYNIKNETDRDHGIPIYDIEFETEYGDYDFEIAIDGGRIVGADYEVDEEWLNTLSGSPVSMEEATEIVAGKVPGSSAADVTIWEESEDGRGRYEGELFFDGMKFEFEIDPQTGLICLPYFIIRMVSVLTFKFNLVSTFSHPFGLDCRRIFQGRL